MTSRRTVRVYKGRKQPAVLAQLDNLVFRYSRQQILRSSGFCAFEVRDEPILVDS